METLYIVLIIVVVFIALLAAAIIGNVIVRNNRKLNKRKRPDRSTPPVIPDIIGNIPNIIPVTATPDKTPAPAGIVDAIGYEGDIYVKNADDIKKYYVSGNDPFVNIFNEKLADRVNYALGNPRLSGLGYVKENPNDIIDSIIGETTNSEGYFGEDDDDLESNPYERLRTELERRQTPYNAMIESDDNNSDSSFDLTLTTTNNGRNYKASIAIVYTPSSLNNNNGNILEYRVVYTINRKENRKEIKYYNIDDRDTMIEDIYSRMPYQA